MTLSRGSSAYITFITFLFDTVLPLSDEDGVMSGKTSLTRDEFSIADVKRHAGSLCVI